MSTQDHNKGQKDAAQGKYDPPIRNSAVKMILATKDDVARDEDYHKGRENVKK